MRDQLLAHAVSVEAVTHRPGHVAGGEGGGLRVAVEADPVADALARDRAAVYRGDDALPRQQAVALRHWRLPRRAASRPRCPRRRAGPPAAPPGAGCRATGRPGG